MFTEEFDYDRAMEISIEEARADGKAKGNIEGQERVNTLNRILIAAKRFVDLEKATNDLDYQNKLMNELLPACPMSWCPMKDVCVKGLVTHVMYCGHHGQVDIAN